MGIEIKKQKAVDVTSNKYRSSILTTIMVAPVKASHTDLLCNRFMRPHAVQNGSIDDCLHWFVCTLFNYNETMMRATNTNSTFPSKMPAFIMSECLISFFHWLFSSSSSTFVMHANQGKHIHDSLVCCCRPAKHFQCFSKWKLKSTCCIRSCVSVYSVWIMQAEKCALTSNASYWMSAGIIQTMMMMREGEEKNENRKWN